MGNHEFNTIAYYMPDRGTGGYLREHSKNNFDQHKAFLGACADSPDKYEDTIDWFKTLPLWLVLGDLRIIHACWDKHEIPLAPNIACLDYSVAKLGGKLVAYRWDGEQTLSRDKFIWVDREEA